jgi:flagellar biosynthesis anti-sigma factor FlgM
MQISNSQINKVYELHLQQVSNVSKSMESGSYSSDHLTISSRAAEVNMISKHVAAMPDVREDKVQAIQTSVLNGEYSSSNYDIATKIYESVV